MTIPFMKWPGGKRLLLPRILPLLPKRIEHYVEPFLGGGAVFLGLAQEGRLVGRVTLSDRNPEVVNIWSVVQSDPEALADLVEALPVDSETYYAVRDADGSQSPLERAARFMYLSRTCFNGLYRLNRQGRFNVPFGGDKQTVRPVNRLNLRACSKALQGVTLQSGDFETALPSEGGPTTVVYCDPPYWPLKAESFVAYDGGSFTSADHERLVQRARALGELGAVVMISNVDVPATRELYAGFHLQSLRVARQISCKVTERKAVSELLAVTSEVKEEADEWWFV